MIEHFLHFALQAVLKRSWDELMHATHEPARMQSSRLLDIIRFNQETLFGKEHGFSEVRSVDDFRNRVPVRTYEDFEPYIRRMRNGEPRVLTIESPDLFGRTSGTTGEPKFIPITSAFYEEFSKMQKMWQRKLVADHRGMLRGKILSVMSSEVDGYTECGTPYGAMSGLSYRLQYPITQMFYAVPYDVMCIGDFETKYYLILRLAVEQDVAAIAALNPSTILLLMKKLNKYAGELCRDIADGALRQDLDIDVQLRRTLQERMRPNKSRAREIERLAQGGGVIRGDALWKNLCILITWQGGSAGFFLREFPIYFANIPFRDVGFVATEGYFSIPLWSNTPNGLLAITGHFFEFFEVATGGGRSDTPLGCEDLEVGKEYFIVVTTSGGLYRYDICDIIEVVDFYNKTPVIVFKQRGGNTISITGEKVTEGQVTEAMRAAVGSLGIPIEGFTLMPRLEDPPSLMLVVETPERNDQLLTRLLTAFESELRLRNIEYRAKRDSQRLGEPWLCLLAPGFFEECRRRRVQQGTPDGQYKIPHIVNDVRKLGELRALAEIPMPAAAHGENRVQP